MGANIKLILFVKVYYQIINTAFMNKIFLMISLGLLCGLSVFSQQKDTLSAADRKALDSMLAKDEFLSVMGQIGNLLRRPRLSISAGIGKRGNVDSDLRDR